MEYQIVEINRTWTVIATDNGKVLGGDRHWLKQEYAEKALEAYVSGHAEHGKLSTVWFLPRPVRHV